jgi:hypothetical protein
MSNYGAYENRLHLQVVGAYSEPIKVRKSIFSFKQPDIDIDLGDSLGNIPLGQRNGIKLEAKRQMYSDMTGKDPGGKSEKALDKVLSRRVLDGSGDDCAKIAVRPIDPNNRTASYLNAMKSLGKSGDSKFSDSFLRDVISHFDNLKPGITEERQNLAEALVQAYKNGQMSSSSRNQLASLKSKSSTDTSLALNVAFSGGNYSALKPYDPRNLSTPSTARQDMVRMRNRQPRDTLVRD